MLPDPKASPLTHNNTEVRGYENKTGNNLSTDFSDILCPEIPGLHDQFEYLKKARLALLDSLRTQEREAFAMGKIFETINSWIEVFKKDDMVKLSEGSPLYGLVQEVTAEFQAVINKLQIAAATQGVDLFFFSADLQKQGQSLEDLISRANSHNCVAIVNHLADLDRLLNRR